MEAIKIGKGATAMEFCSGVDRLGSTLNTALEMGIYSQEVGGSQWTENY